MLIAKGREKSGRIGGRGERRREKKRFGPIVEVLEEKKKGKGEELQRKKGPGPKEGKMPEILHLKKRSYPQKGRGEKGGRSTQLNTGDLTQYRFFDEEEGEKKKLADRASLLKGTQKKGFRKTIHIPKKKKDLPFVIGSLGKGWSLRRGEKEEKPSRSLWEFPVEKKKKKGNDYFLVQREKRKKKGSPPQTNQVKKRKTRRKNHWKGDGPLLGGKNGKKPGPITRNKGKDEKAFAVGGKRCGAWSD